MLTQLADDIWIFDHPLRFFGASLGTRTTIIRLPNGGLWLHSPGPIEAYRSILETLGKVHSVVAPNLFHHLFVAETLAAFPEAQFYATHGLAKKVKQPSWTQTLTVPPQEWGGVIAQHTVGGMPRVNETLFLHRPSRTLIMTDLAFNFRAHHPLGFWTRIFLKLIGAWDRFGPSRFDKLLMKDKAQVRIDMDTVLTWDIDRITVCHGEVLATGGLEALRSSFAEIG